MPTSSEVALQPWSNYFIQSALFLRLTELLRCLLDHGRVSAQKTAVDACASHTGCSYFIVVDADRQAMVSPFL